MYKLTVGLDDRSYDISIESNLLSKTGILISGLGLGKRCAVISDRTVFEIYGEKVIESLESAGFVPSKIVLQPGEGTKSLSTMEGIYGELLSYRLDRKSFIVALGGGVVGDIAGFAAASYMRGIPFVQLPTTLLAQVDSSVGGKVGVNIPRGKNIVGAFHQPVSVIIDPAALETLDERQMRAGFVEVFKHGIIRDASYFDFVEENAEHILNLDELNLAEAIYKSCIIKSDVVHLDERESGLRAILNFGHTVGHALESLTGYKRYVHGEAVAVGMIAAIRISDIFYGKRVDPHHRIESLIKKCRLPNVMPRFDSEEIYQAMTRDKKNIDDNMRMVLLKEIGEVEIVPDVDEKIIIEALNKIPREEA
jgi:3-dehydroquinate synthase